MNKKKQKEPIIIYDEYQDEYEFQEVKNFLVNLCEKNYCVLSGSAGTWRGNCDGGAVIESYDRLSDIWNSGYGDLQILDDNGELIFKYIHHDGTDVWHLRRLTDAGVRKFEKLEYNSRPTREIVDTLMNSSHLSKKIRIMKELYDVK